MADLKTMAEVRKALKGARGARLYQNGDLEIYRRDTVAVPYRPKDGSPEVSVRILVRGFSKATWSPHWGQYMQDVSPNDRPDIVVCFRDSTAPLLLGDIQHVTVYLQNNSTNMQRYNLDQRTVIFQYKGAGEVYFNYVSTAGHPELLDNVTSSEVTLRFAAETPEERPNTVDLVWEMAEREKAP